MTPIEKVARAIAPETFLLPRINLYKANYEAAWANARAAIEALAEPSEEMVLAGWDQLSLEPSPHAAEACWQAMIAVALQQKQEG